MKKAIVIFLSLTMLLSASACNRNTESSENTSSEIVQTVEPIQLVNKMTETELSRVDKHELTLLDVPEEPTTEAEPAQTEHKVSVEFHTPSIDEWRENIESYRDHMTDEEYETAMENIRIAEEKGENGGSPYARIILVDGYLVPYAVPYADPNYDGGLIAFTTSTMDENGETKTEELSFESFEEYLDWIRKMDAEYGYSDEMIEQDVLYVQVANEALKTGDYEVLPEGTINTEDPSLYLWYEEETGDFRDLWEYDRNAVEAIKDSIDEISIYDEELDKEFVVHVTLPPDYDKDKTYPVFFLTDGIWRFGNHTELRKVIEDGEAAPVILVSIWYSYNVNDADGNIRYFDLVVNCDKMLDFITDNLMPYLCENYHIDCATSTLYGHSDGGVFAHNALFKSDLYENQPFGNYIIGSPALWGLYNYNDYYNISSDDVENDYGYFDRNEQLNKSLFLCAGSLEDPDYADNYNGHDTTLEGIAKLKERMESHGADLTYKLYDSHHYQFIPEMLIEFLKETYPKQ
ncbi:MAG: hypothetical protein K2G25_01345 [Oscillospiraceae bacterium]|nr:hypothetical protein [Oscillospiraceae bacterium]